MNIYNNRNTPGPCGQEYQFTTMFMLKKNKFAQLPDGMFSDAINYDRQDSYEKLCKRVQEEINKLPPHLKQFVERRTDDHIEQDPDPPDSPEGPPYQPQVGDIVNDHKNGGRGRITHVGPNGEIDIEPIVEPQGNK